MAASDRPDLNYPGYVVLAVHEQANERVIEVEVRPPIPRAPCPGCGQVDAKGYGWRTHTMRDAPDCGKFVIVKVRMRRYRCRHCARAFSDASPMAEPGRSMTKRLAYAIWLAGRDKTKSNVTIAKAFGVSEGTIRDLSRKR